MAQLAERMAMYAAYHQHPVNRAIHFVGIPAIVWSLMLLLAFVEVFETGTLRVTLAHVAVLGLLGWYLSMDTGLGIASVLVFTVLLVSALGVQAALSTPDALLVAGLVHVAGWAVQFVGHGVWEKRRPALFDNLAQAFVAPVFLVAEAAFALGLRKQLHGEVRQALELRRKPAPA